MSSNSLTRCPDPGHVSSLSLRDRVPAHHSTFIRTSAISLPPTPRVHLLLQHNAIHTRLQQCKHETRFSFQLSESIKNLRCWLARHGVQETRQLEQNPLAQGLIWPAPIAGSAYRIPSSYSQPAARTPQERPAPAG